MELHDMSPERRVCNQVQTCARAAGSRNGRQILPRIKVPDGARPGGMFAGGLRRGRGARQDHHAAGARKREDSRRPVY
jgi:hypothetical protein